MMVVRNFFRVLAVVIVGAVLVVGSADACDQKFYPDPDDGQDYITITITVEDFHKAKKAAKQGDADAQQDLGSMYYFSSDELFFRRSTGLIYAKERGIPQSYKEAAKWFKKAAEKGKNEAQCRLGDMYFSGIGVPENRKEAARWFKKAAEKGNYYAQFELGFMYHVGQGVPQGYKEAAKWFKKATKMYTDTAKILFLIGARYYKGSGVPQSYKEAARWWKKAAELGSDSAQFQIGHMYFEGEGVPQNYIKAHKWMNIAASNGNKTYVDARDAFARKMSKEQIAEAQRLASEFVPERRTDNATDYERFIQLTPKSRQGFSGWW